MTSHKPLNHDFWRERLERGREMGLESELGKKALEAGRMLDIDGVRAHAESLVSCISDSPIYGELLCAIGDAQIVLIGEATHGSREFYEERANITKRLIEEKGFSLVVCEADLVDMARVDRYVRGESLDGSAAAALSGFSHYPLWIWRNKEVESFVDWARRYNEKVFLKGKPNGCAVSIHGCDLHGLYKSLDVVIQYLEKRDPEAAERAKKRYSGFAPFAPDAHEYGFATSGGRGNGFEDDVTRELAELQDMGRPAAAGAREGTYGHRCQDDEYFFAMQNAVLVKEAEAYYRTIYESYEAAWIIRDRYMFNALLALKEHCEALCGRVCRVVVWAHNCHVSDARATEIAWDWHQINTGQLCKERYGDGAFSIGFSTFGGTLTAAPAWGEPGRCVRLSPPAPGTFECILEQVSPARFLLDSRRAEPHDVVLMKRSIGLVYREDAEADNYYRAKVFQQYDRMIHIGRTTAVEPLDERSASNEIEEADEMPQTYPFGI